MDTLKISEAASAWINAWNTGDLPTILDHYSEDVVFYSNAAARRWNVPGGRLVGKTAVTNHFKKAFEEVPGMKLTFTKILFGTDGVLLLYQRETGAASADFVSFNTEGKVKEVRVFTEGH